MLAHKKPHSPFRLGGYYLCKAKTKLWNWKKVLGDVYFAWEVGRSGQFQNLKLEPDQAAIGNQFRGLTSEWEVVWHLCLQNETCCCILKHLKRFDCTCSKTFAVVRTRDDISLLMLYLIHNTPYSQLGLISTKTCASQHKCEKAHDCMTSQQAVAPFFCNTSNATDQTGTTCASMQLILWSI